MSVMLHRRYLELFLLQTVLEAQQHGRRFTVNIAVLEHGNQTLAIHRFTGEELQILEASEQILHYLVDVGLEHLNLFRRLLFKLGHKLLHVILQVGGELFFVGETGLDETVVQDDVDSALGGRIRAFVSFLGRWVGTIQLHVTQGARYVLTVHLVHDVVHQLHLVGVGEHLVTGEDILPNFHFAGGWRKLRKLRCFHLRI
uniref:Putative secreted protein n=1 Tax=Anopheles darlingi TaxID=43151 RepID=A0A2M4DK77_ANODA